MAQKVQIVFQGGGAKLVQLLAVGECLQEMNGKEIRITRVAGTSAGSIVAGLIAAGIQIQDVRTKLLSRGFCTSHLEKMMAKNNVLLKDKLLSVPAKFGVGKNLVAYRKFLQNEPFADQTQFRRVSVGYISDWSRGR